MHGHYSKLISDDPKNKHVIVRIFVVYFGTK